MKQAASIDVTTVQDGERLSLKCDGHIFDEDGTTFIEYALAENSGVIMGISDDTVSISCVGESSYTMILQEGKSSVFALETAGGTLSALVHAEKLLKKIDAAGVKVFLSYRVKFADISLRHKVKLDARFLRP